MRRAGLALAGLVVAAAAWGQPGAGPASEPQAPAPELCIAAIGLSPRYPAYEVEYPDGLPQALDPDSGRPLAPEEAARVQRWPRPGEEVAASAQIVNLGASVSGPFRYAWLLDGRRLAEGLHPGLPPLALAPRERRRWPLKGAVLAEWTPPEGTAAELTARFRWRPGQALELRLVPEGGAGAGEVRVEATDALAFAVLVSRSAYAAWQHGERGTRPFERWVRERFDRLQERLARSVYPSAPTGVRQPIRIDTLRVVEGAQDLEAFRAVRALNGWDGVLCVGDGPPPGDAEIEDALLDQLGLIRPEALRVAPEANAVRDPQTGELAGIGYAPPAPIPGDERRLSEHEVLALNRMAGFRRGYRGVYFFDLPRSCRLRLLDNDGRPLEGAEVALYQREPPDGRIPDRPVALGRTGADGLFPLPNRPAPPIETEIGFRLRPNPFGALRADGANGLLLARLVARGQTEYHWLPIARFNLAFWRGEREQTTLDLRTRLPSLQAPPPPADLALRMEPGGESGPGLALSWAPPPRGEIVAYFIYRAAPPVFEWERVAAVTALHTRHTDRPPPTLLAGRLRYAVTAVDLDGHESGLGRPVEWRPGATSGAPSGPPRRPPDR